ncbi:M24 family metallopeptidase [Paenibacillus sp. GCM10012307]|uniref:Aminopeptidase P family protein n=1 Tax=Paenibacillus roseus TaxID=2798579 RepID=A0A934J702_9BACL|nr:Xaa-Pro peptidase family protein [Paenibacillus roseus]MBJ6361535.1 aminopeptidase P family protein [Paenibacillus roseus]
MKLDWQADSRGERTGRIGKLQNAMRKAGLDAFLATQNVDLYYLTGSMQTGYMLIPAEGEPTYYVRRSVARAISESSFRAVPLGSFRNFAGTLAADYPKLFGGIGPVRIGTELDVLPTQVYLKLSEMLNASSTKVELVDGSGLIRRIRMVKSPYELGRISAAAEVVDGALTAALPYLREGMTELEWMARLEHELRVRGHIGLMRMRGYNQEVITGMVGSGAAAAESSYFDGPAGGRGLGPSAPQSVSRKTFARNEPILIDIGCCMDGYVIDQTRTAVIGDLPADLLRAYEVSVHIIRAVENSLKPGTPADALYAEALKMAADAGLSEHFMGYGEDRVKFLGHGIGLEIDEWPVLAKGFANPLEAGMVLAVEPKFTFPGRGVVGIENTYIITEGGPLALTRSKEELIILPIQ